MHNEKGQEMRKK